MGLLVNGHKITWLAIVVVLALMVAIGFGIRSGMRRRACARQRRLRPGP